jgi:hypothetical protein
VTKCLSTEDPQDVWVRRNQLGSGHVQPRAALSVTAPPGDQIDDNWGPTAWCPADVLSQEERSARSLGTSAWSPAGCGHIQGSFISSHLWVP